MTFPIKGMSSRLGARIVALVILVYSSQAPPLYGQAGAVRTCPTKSTLKLDQVVGLIANAVPDDHIKELIDVCHIGFSLDVAALDKLAAAGISSPVFDALNRDTVSRMSVAAAHAEVAMLEESQRSNEKSINARRDAAVWKSDAEYKTRRDQAAYIAPKTTYEKTVDYNARVQRANANLAAMDRSHEAERAQITQQFAADLAKKNDFLDRRIAILKGAIYPATVGAPAFVGYDADRSRLTVNIAGEEFWFTAEPPRAKAINEHWSSVKILQPYEDDEMHDRFISESVDLEPVRGVPSRLVKKIELDRQIASLLASARTAYLGHSYEQARGLYGQVRGLDPNNQEADEGIAAAEAAIAAETIAKEKSQEGQRKLAALRQQLTQNPKLFPGLWYDAATNLLWTDKDNGSGITWQEANAYCQAFQSNGYASWRLGTIGELQTLYDHSKTRTRMSFGKLMDPNNKSLGVEQYHIKGNIHLSGTTVWSGTTQNSNKGLQAVMASFEAGGQAPFDISTTTGRALCIHRLDDPNGMVAPSEPPEVDSGTVSPSTGGAILNVISGFPSAPGVKNIMAGIPLKLMQDDFAATLSKGGLPLKTGLTPQQALNAACAKSESDCLRMIRASVANPVASATSNTAGSGTFPPVPSGTYYVRIYGYYNSHHIFWNLRMNLRPGENSVTLNLRNGILLD